MRLIAATALLLVLGSTDALAQDASPPDKRFAEARARLAKEANDQLLSEDMCEVAWGAHSAAEHRLTACVPALRAKLRELADLAPTARAHTALAVLDALIQTEARVPADELKPFVQALTIEPALLLLKPHAEDHLDLFLAVYRERGVRGETRRACGDVLADARHPAFALELLREPMTVVLHVFDPGKVDEEAVAFGMHSISCYRYSAAPKGFPPTVRYRLASGKRDKSTGYCDPVDSDTRAAPTRWMRTMLGESATAVPFDLAPDIGVEWLSREQVEAAETQHKERLTTMLRTLASLCVKQKLVTEQAAAALEPNIKLWWFDCRVDPKDPLPQDRMWLGF